MSNFDSYDLSDMYEPTGGADFVPGFLDDFAREWVGKHYLVSLALIVILVVVVLCLWFCPVENFIGSTATVRFQQRDGLGESMTADRLPSFFSADSGTILASADYACKSRDGVSPADAWAWQQGAIAENMSNKGNVTDNEFSRILAGHK